MISRAEQIDPTGRAPASVRRVLEEICSLWPVERIVLFGSRAVGDHQSRSDCDLAISAPSMDKRQWVSLQNFVADSNTLFKVAVSSLDNMPFALRQQVLLQGVVLYDLAQGTRQPREPFSGS